MKKLFKYLLFSKILSHGQLGRFRHLAAALFFMCSQAAQNKNIYSSAGFNHNFHLKNLH